MSFLGRHGALIIHGLGEIVFFSAASYQLRKALELTQHFQPSHALAKNGKTMDT